MEFRIFEKLNESLKKKANIHCYITITDHKNLDPHDHDLGSIVAMGWNFETNRLTYLKQSK